MFAIINSRWASGLIKIRLRSSCLIAHLTGVTLNPNFTKEEEIKILDTLNTSNAEQLSKFNVTKTRIKSLVIRRTKKGPFQSLDDVLEVDGLGIKVLEKLCESIVNDENNVANNNNMKTSVGSKNRRQFLLPTLDPEHLFLSSAVALHLGAAGASWAKLTRDGNVLDSWGSHDFSTIPKKMLPTDTFQLAMTILNEIPTGDVYVFEATPNINPQQKQSTLIASYNQQMELTSMLLALINTSPNHRNIIPNANDVTNPKNSVYYLKSNLSARLFKTLMGTERVSSTITVSNILDSAKNNTDNALPCTPITIGKTFYDQYYSQLPVARELLGQAFLLAITFMDLCIYNNQASLLAVAPGKRLN